jgi:hypothetical protein
MRTANGQAGGAGSVGTDNLWKSLQSYNFNVNLINALKGVYKSTIM